MHWLFSPMCSNTSTRWSAQLWYLFRALRGRLGMVMLLLVFIPSDFTLTVLWSCMFSSYICKYNPALSVLPESHILSLIAPFKNIGLSFIHFGYFCHFTPPFQVLFYNLIWSFFFSNLQNKLKHFIFSSWKRRPWTFRITVCLTQCQLVCFQLVLCLGVVTSANTPSQLPLQLPKR